MPAWRGSFQRNAAGGFVHGITHDRNAGQSHSFGIGITPIFVDIGNHVEPGFQSWQVNANNEWELRSTDTRLHYVYDDEGVFERSVQCYHALNAAIASADWNSQRMARPVPRIVLTHPSGTKLSGDATLVVNCGNPSPGLNLPSVVIPYEPPGFTPLVRDNIGNPPGTDGLLAWFPPTDFDSSEGAVIERDRAFRSGLASRAWQAMFEGFAWQNLNEVAEGIPVRREWIVIQHADNRFADCSFDLYHAESSVNLSDQENNFGVGGGLQTISALAAQAQGLPAPTNACVGCRFIVRGGGSMGDTTGWLGWVNGFLSDLLGRGGFPTPPECSP